VGFEHLKSDVKLMGEARFIDDFYDLVKKSSDRAKKRCNNDITQLEGYLESIKKPGDYATNNKNKEAYDDVLRQIRDIKCRIENLCMKNQIILIGGYKGLLRSLDSPEADTKGAIFATTGNHPLGFAEISDIREVSYDEQK